MICNRTFAVAFLCLLLMLFLLPVAYASSDVENFKKGFLDLVELGKYALLFVAILAVIRELFTKRNIFLILGIIGVTAALAYLAYPDKMTNLGKEIVSPFMGG